MGINDLLNKAMNNNVNDTNLQQDFSNPENSHDSSNKKNSFGISDFLLKFDLRPQRLELLKQRSC